MRIRWEFNIGRRVLFLIHRDKSIFHGPCVGPLIVISVGDGSVGISVGGSLVAVGGSLVAVGGSSVAVGGSEVAVNVGGGIRVLVGEGRRVLVGEGKGVLVGGLGVLVGGTRVGVNVALGRRVTVDVNRGRVGNADAVNVGEGGIAVARGVGVESSMLTATACTVSADTVFRF